MLISPADFYLPPADSVVICTSHSLFSPLVSRLSPPDSVVLYFAFALLPNRTTTFGVSFLSQSSSPHIIARVRLLSLPNSRFLCRHSILVMLFRKADSVADMYEEERVKLLAQIRRMDSHDACDALCNIRPYLEPAGGGCVYMHLQPNWEQLDLLPAVPLDQEVDYLDFKICETSDIVRRRAEYDKCVGEPIIWCFYYPTAFPKLIERLTHITLTYIRARRAPYPSRGCLVRHREHVSEYCANMELVATTIEYWIRRIGEIPTPSSFALRIGSSPKFDYHHLRHCFRVFSLNYRLPTSSFLSLRSNLAMPFHKADSVADMDEAQCVKILGQIRRMDPHDACDALCNLRPYLEPAGGGCVYTHLRLNWEQLDLLPAVPLDQEIDYLDLKIGETGNLENRRAAYAKCQGEPIVWCYYYPTACPKLIERLTHITLAYIGAKRASYPCWGCFVRHREHVSEHYTDLELVATTIEYWMRRIGEVPVRHEMYEE
ncbi:hypothetical protein C8R45DRAFT_1115547 [Mycena sanguinolenta]|nr:hypothetical protein C8R45DRAFT_1115547 [Mycena sanguinolenta]